MSVWQQVCSGIQKLSAETQAAGALGGLIVLAAVLIATAIRQHAKVLQQLAHAQITEQSASLALDEGNWRRVVEQIIADITHEEVYIASFSAMCAGRKAWIRFVARDGRAYVFATRHRLADCRGRGRRITAHISPPADGELRALWGHFMQQSGMASPLPRQVHWHLLPPQVGQRCRTIAPRALALPTIRRNRLRFSLWRWLGT